MSTSLDWASKLHNRFGFVVFSKVLKSALTDEVRDYFRNFAENDDDAELIFNDSVMGGDQKRSQAFLKSTDEQFNVLEQKLGAFLKGYFPNHNPTDYVVLLSRARCSEQLPHTDITQEDLQNVTDDLEEMPLGCIISLSDNTTLDVWPGAFGKTFWKCDNNSQKYRWDRIDLDVGDVVVFRGDLVHAGSAYRNENVRLHCFLDHPCVKREKNTTFFMDGDERIYPRYQSKRLKTN